jgi:hypothetical protein
MMLRHLPHPKNLIDALSYIKGSAKRQACAEWFKAAFKMHDRTITVIDLMTNADVHLAWRQRLGEPDAIEITVEYGLYRHAVLVEPTGFDLTEAAEA